LTYSERQYTTVVLFHRRRVEEQVMKKRIPVIVVASALGVAGIAAGQQMILNMVADKVIQKYQSASSSSCGNRRANPSRRKRKGREFRMIRRPARNFSTRSPAGRQQDVRMRNDSLSPLRLDRVNPRGAMNHMQ
jgi:hypothetical protein